MYIIQRFFFVMLICPFLWQGAIAQRPINYDIFSTIIDKRYGHIPYKYILVADSTDIPRDFVYKVKSFEVKRILTTKKFRSTLQSWESFLKKFSITSKQKVKIDNNFTTNTKLRFVSSHYQFDTNWPFNAGKTPLTYDRAGINVLTPVYYSEDKQKALCAINLVFPEEGESETLFLFEKQKSEWVLVYDTILTVTAR